MDEAELIGAARSGDRQAFDELVRRTFVDTFTLARRLTGNEEDARDVVQEAYLRAWKGIGKFRGDAAVLDVAVPHHRQRRVDARRKRRRRQRAEPLRRRLRARRRPRRGAARGAGAESAEALERIVARARRAAAEAAQRRRAEGRLRPVARGDRRRARHLGVGREGAAAPGPAQAARRAVRRRSRGPCGVTRSPRCCPGWSTATTVEPRGRAPRRVVPALPGRARALPPAAAHARAAAHPLRRADAGLLGETLAALTDAAEHGARRTLLSGRRLAYAGAIGGSALAAGRDRRAADRPLPQARPLRLAG